jgi:uncharacterized protein
MHGLFTMEILIGFIIGVAIGTTGVGGGTLTAPAMILILGFSPRVSVATALVFSACVKVWASSIYLLRNQVDVRVLGYLLGGGLPGAILGAVLLEHLRSSKTDGWIMMAIGLIISASAATSLFRARNPGPKSSSRTHWLPIPSFFIGMETAFSSAGAGALGSVLLFNLGTLAPSVVVGTDLVFGMVISAVGGSIHAMAGSCEWPALIKMVPAGLLGSAVGAQMAGRLPSRMLRTAVLICATLVGILLIRNGIGWSF